MLVALEKDITSFVVSGVFSPIRSTQETHVKQIIQEVCSSCEHLLYTICCHDHITYQLLWHDFATVHSLMKLSCSCITVHEHRWQKLWRCVMSGLESNLMHLKDLGT